MRRRTWHVLMGFLGVVVLVGCGGQARAVATPEAVHQQWVTAMRANDRAAALAVAAPETLPPVVVDQALARIQDIVRHQSNGRIATGPLLDVTTRPLDERGRGKAGISVWHFAQVTWCWETQLATTAQGWRVVAWGMRATCPAGA